MPAPLADHVALVTGGGTRLGRAIALSLARAGARVAIAYRESAAGAAATLREIADGGGRAESFRCDVRDAAQVVALVADATASLGPIDLLVLNAGVFRRTPIEQATDDDWDFHMDTNAKGPYLCARRVGVSMRERGGAIVVIADTAGLRPWGNYVPYSASKAAAISLTQGLAIALAPKVRVNAIAPGPILPPTGGDDAAIQRAAARTLLQRHGRAEDICAAVLYLATADFVTGVILPVDGGRHLA